MKTLKNVLIITDSATVTADIVCNSIKQVIYIYNCLSKRFTW